VYNVGCFEFLYTYLRFSRKLINLFFCHAQINEIRKNQIYLSSQEI